MPPTVDKPITHVVIVGGGVMGLSCCHSIASQHPGYRVTLVDSSTPDTVRSSRGDSRGLQFGYEGVYSGLVKESARLWLQLEQHDAKKRALVAPCGVPLVRCTPVKSNVNDLTYRCRRESGFRH